MYEIKSVFACKKSRFKWFPGSGGFSPAWQHRSCLYSDLFFVWIKCETTDCSSFLKSFTKLNNYISHGASVCSQWSLKMMWFPMNIHSFTSQLTEKCPPFFIFIHTYIVFTWADFLLRLKTDFYWFHAGQFIFIY